MWMAILVPRVSCSSSGVISSPVKLGVSYFPCLEIKWHKALTAGIWSVLGGSGDTALSNSRGRHICHRLGTQCPLELSSAQPVQPYPAIPDGDSWYSGGGCCFLLYLLFLKPKVPGPRRRESPVVRDPLLPKAAVP